MRNDCATIAQRLRNDNTDDGLPSRGAVIDQERRERDAVCLASARRRRALSLNNWAGCVTSRSHRKATRRGHAHPPDGVRPVSAFAEPWLRQSERPGDYSTDLVRRTCIDPARSPRTGNCETIANLNCTRLPHTEIHGSGKVVSNLNAVIY